ncbi:hypothetical protein [Aphanothece sacrum]|uniref:Uncharacterized protein n=1 Tax=Aphanothece sacrum FPU1 TaxID=1920663 RepID=A0A401IEX6_APHSA|nr:hypothetical protein [Aphanothece sacrum]GBF79759.1 hypothetical protein AsFPU1_1158 [Aphanothece sacrum FPU1]GBF84772.1 hypothetical protein AsFPU3_1826 [Aphanothece sacrum FPU3]
MIKTPMRPEYKTLSKGDNLSESYTLKGYGGVCLGSISENVKKTQQIRILTSDEMRQTVHNTREGVVKSKRIFILVNISSGFQKPVDFYSNLAKIKEYFNASPQERVSIKKSCAKHIQTTEDVLTVLYLGNSPDFKDAYDGAVALLAECKQLVLSQSIQVFRQKLIHKYLVFTEEYKLEILIKSVSCASLISSARKLELITSLFVRNLGRLTKLTLIDALIILEDEVNKKLIEVYLEHFTSDKESDEYVRVAAQKAISENKNNQQEKTLYDKFEESGLIGFCSVEEDLSTTYKQVLSDTLNAKYDHC